MKISIKQHKIIRTIAIVGVVLFGGIAMWSGIAEVTDSSGPGDFGDVSATIGFVFLVVMLILPTPEETQLE